MGFLEQLRSVWALVGQAPWSFVSLAVVLVVGGWAAGRFMFGERIEALKSRIEKRDEELADYKNKLHGASPDEARSQMDRLEARIQELREHFTPRTLTTDQFAAITKVASRKPGHVRVLSHPIAADAAYLAQLIQGAFAVSGWKISTGTVIAPSTPNDPPSGIFVLLPDQPTLSSHAALDALREAKIDVFRSDSPVNDVDVEIVVSARSPA